MSLSQKGLIAVLAGAAFVTPAIAFDEIGPSKLVNPATNTITTTSTIPSTNIRLTTILNCDFGIVTTVVGSTAIHTTSSSSVLVNGNVTNSRTEAARQCKEAKLEAKF